MHAAVRHFNAVRGIIWLFVIPVRSKRRRVAVHPVRRSIYNGVGRFHESKPKVIPGGTAI